MGMQNSMLLKPLDREALRQIDAIHQENVPVKDWRISPTSVFGDDEWIMEGKRTRKKSVKPEAVRADFHAALDRLIEGKPKSKDLRAQAALGRLKINSTNLAKEAGRSAALIWRANYADVKERLESLSVPKRSTDVPPTA